MRIREIEKIRVWCSKAGRICLLVLLSVGVLGLVGTTYAYYTGQNKIENGLITKGGDVYLMEYFSPDDLWLAGETKYKEVWFGNQSGIKQVIRFQILEEWFDNNGTPEDYSDDTPWVYTGSYSPPPAVINWTDEIAGASPTWTKIGDYYYYNYILEGGTKAAPAETPVVFDSVTFSPELGNIEAYGEDFSDKRYQLTVKMETLSVDSAKTWNMWQVNFSDSGGTLQWSS